ncbi:TRAP transporter small permease [Pseudovibrio exalbescens]|uniref:TRAP transporter small permease n=1 Tax=Pseudovibrio exalbescens TaxID=197461 RepID=UPI00236688EE|nr:TRAP transporter small permease [Pseudovibrio exalbescens]MDD7909871.1 TRAP transporter small permease [Pseudovibrio exalbescens]
MTRATANGRSALSARSVSQLLLNLLGLCCVLLLICLTSLTLVDVVGRYWFNAPLRGAFEITQLLLCALVFAALPLTTQAKEHVEVDLIYGMVPPVMQGVMRFTSAAVSTIVLGVLAWRLAHHAEQLAEDGTITNALNIPFAPLAWFAAVCALLSGLYALQHLLTALRRGY